MKRLQVSRRTALSVLSASSLSFKPLQAAKRIPIGLEIYSVRDEFKKNEINTLEAISGMGYECVEFHSVYADWTPERAKQIRSQLDRLNLKCYSTHNDKKVFSGDDLKHTIDLNKILGSHYIVLASGGKVTAADEWKQLADLLNKANSVMRRAGLRAGYHNHAAEWKLVDGKLPMQILAENTDKAIMLQLDVGHCLEAGGDPVAWINNHPGRTRSVHLKDWSKEKGFQALFGEGIAPWKKILSAAQNKGGVEYYLIEQEGDKYPELETADRCLIAYRNVTG
ncbi:MAG: sugar phosphate isomerase/epimerase family protein [Bryobacteraceae bacterium]